MNQNVPDQMNDHAVAWLIVIPICSVETVVCLFAIASRTHWKCPDVLLFSFVFIQLLYLTIPMLIYSINVRRNDISMAVCRLVVWCVLSFRIMMSLHMTYLAMDRVWILKWPRAYHLHNTNRQSCKNSIFMWLFGMSIGAIGLSNWRESDLDLYLKCGLVLYTPNYVYSLCVIVIILGSLVLGVMCVGTLVVDTIRTQETDPVIPTIIIEDEIGMKTQTVKVAKEEQNRQVNKIVCFIFSVYYVLSVLPFVIVNLYSLPNMVDDWMPIVIQWCTLIGYVINPILMGVVCDRYRKGYVRCLGNLGCMAGGKSERNQSVQRQETLDSLDNVPSTENTIEFHSPMCEVMDNLEKEIDRREQVPHGSIEHQTENSLIIPNDDSFIGFQEECQKEDLTFENEVYEKDHDMTKSAEIVNETETSNSKQVRNNRRRQKRKLSNEEKIRRAKERYQRSKQADSPSSSDKTEVTRTSRKKVPRSRHKETNDVDLQSHSSSTESEVLEKDTSTEIGSSLYDIPEECPPPSDVISIVGISNQSRDGKIISNFQISEIKNIEYGSLAKQTDSFKSMLPLEDNFGSDKNDGPMNSLVKISAREMREKFRESRQQEAHVVSSNSSSEAIVFV
ncbi:uncharacterized protein LOC117106638 isoform X2 [Anneissia japonica]|nr:uncharacterized protein LOC117106638 isoform X2 [Anneissia japonica]